MADVKEVLAWAKGVGEQALTEARAGDPTLANKLGGNSAMKLFFDNVVATKNVQENQFPAYYPIQWKEIKHLYEAYIRDEEVSQTVGKVSVLEGKIDKLEAMITKLLENAEQPAVTPAPVADPTVEPEPEEEDLPKAGKKPAAKKPDATPEVTEGDPTPEPEA